MAQFWVNDTPGGARTLSLLASQSQGMGREWGDPAGSLVGLWDPCTHSGEQVLGQDWAPPLLPGVTPLQLKGAPTAPLARGGGGGDRSGGG